MDHNYDREDLNYQENYHYERGTNFHFSETVLQPSQEVVNSSDPKERPSVSVSPAKRQALASAGEFGRRNSPIWKHYTFLKKDGSTYAKCNYCQVKMYKADSNIGTSNPSRHTKKCPAYLEFCSKNPDNAMSNAVFDQNRYCELFAEAIMCHNYPLSIVEHERLKILHRFLNPKVQNISRYTITKYCMLQHTKYKNKLLDTLKSVSSRICFTCDGWSACTSRSYFVLTAHFVDNNWKLQSKILSFRRFPPPHDGESIFQLVKLMLVEWGLYKKVFTVTLDNASANDSMMVRLRDDLQVVSPLPCDGKYLHVRCAAHILNLIVQKGLEVIDVSVKKVRNIVKYIDSSDTRLTKFEAAVRDCNSRFSGKLLLDMPVRWNSTYSMIRRALDAKPALCLFAARENLDVITECEWEIIQKTCGFLEPFYRITMLFSGTNYPTSNLFLANIVAIESFLCRGHRDPCEAIQKMAQPMLDKFEKYWSEQCMILSFAVLLDPRFKMDFIRASFSTLYCDEEVNRRVNDIYNEFVALYDMYSLPGEPSSSSSTAQSSTSSGPHFPSYVVGHTFDFSDLFRNFNANNTANRGGKVVVDSYLNSPLHPQTSGSTFDILEYWKIHSQEYPVLSNMARDILAIPITSVASESSFSLGGRVLSKLRASLLPKNVEIYVTTSNWMYGFEAEEKHEEYLSVAKEILEDLDEEQ